MSLSAWQFSVHLETISNLEAYDLQSVMKKSRGYDKFSDSLVISTDTWKERIFTEVSLPLDIYFTVKISKQFFKKNGQIVI